jgi:hypothetical protein
VVNPTGRAVSVHRRGIEVSVLKEGNALEGLEVVPGFRCEVSEIFG